MKHHDEKGRKTVAQSKVAKSMRPAEQRAKFRQSHARRLSGIQKAIQKYGGYDK